MISAGPREIGGLSPPPPVGIYDDGALPIYDRCCCIFGFPWGLGRGVELRGATTQRRNHDSCCRYSLSAHLRVLRDHSSTSPAGAAKSSWATTLDRVISAAPRFTNRRIPPKLGLVLQDRGNPLIEIGRHGHISGADGLCHALELPLEASV